MRAPLLASIIVIADEQLWSKRVAGELADEGFFVVVDASGDSAFDRRSHAADALIVDLALTARPAIDVCVAWRARSRTPILAVAHDSDEVGIMEAFAAGVDQVTQIDVSSRLVIARLRALLRRTWRGEGDGGLPTVVLDPQQVAAVVHGTVVPLTDQEFAVLGLLLARIGRVVRRYELLAVAHGVVGGPRSIDFVVRRLRQKLEAVDVSRRIVAVRGVGFRFLADGASATDDDIAVVCSPTDGGAFIAGSEADQAGVVPSIAVAVGQER